MKEVKFSKIQKTKVAGPYLNPKNSLRGPEKAQIVQICIFPNCQFLVSSNVESALILDVFPLISLECFKLLLSFR